MLLCRLTDKGGLEYDYSDFPTINTKIKNDGFKRLVIFTTHNEIVIENDKNQILLNKSEILSHSCSGKSIKIITRYTDEFQIGTNFEKMVNRNVVYIIEWVFNDDTKATLEFNDTDDFVKFEVIGV